MNGTKTLSETYRQGHFNDPNTLRSLRLVFVAFALLYAAFAYTDRIYFLDNWQFLWLLRFGLVVPLLISTIILSYRAFFPKIKQLYIAMNMFVGGVVIAIMLMMAPENIVYYGGLFMVLFSGYFIIQLRFWYATATGWGLVLFYLIGMAVTDGLAMTSLHASLFFAGANLIGMMGLKYLENLNMRQVNASSKVHEMNVKLKEQTEAQRAQLIQLESFIAENRSLNTQFNQKNRLTLELQVVQKRFEDLARQTRTFFFEITSKGHFLYVSESVETLLGYRAEDIVDQYAFHDLFPKDTHALYQTKLDAILSARASHGDFVMPLVAHDQTTIWVNTHFYPVLNQEGTLQSYQGSCLDVSKQRHTQSRFELVRSMVTQAEYGAALANLEGTLVYVNDAFCSMHGYTREELIGQPIAIVHDESQLSHVKALTEKLLESGRFTSEEVGHRHKSGRLFPTVMSASLIKQDGKPAYMSATILDVTELKQAQTDLSDTEKRYRLVSELSTTGVWEFDLIKQSLWCSPEYFHMLGWTDKDFSADPDNLQERWLDLLHEEDKERAQAAFENYCTNKPNTLYENRFRMRTASGDYRWIWSRGSFILDASGQPTDLIIGTHIDITNQRLKELEIERLSKYDMLTEIPNRRYFQEQLVTFDQEAFYPLAIAILDVNGLKLVNDSFGHSTGNRMLKQVAKVLDTHKRPQDFIARIGGDEFVMLCPNTDQETMHAIKDALQAVISTQRIEELEYSLAIGYEIKETKHRETRDVLKEAENHMYKNKVLYGSSTRNQAVMTILQTLTTKFTEERVHSERVSRYCRRIGEVMQLREEELIELELAGKLHDIGKISIPDYILNKPGPLTDEEWVIMKEHTINGYQILRAADRYSNLAEYAMSHHERIDGTGYPNGLKGKAIPLYARIISVADAYEAMTSDRCYRKGMLPNQAKAELKKHAGTQFDPDIVKIFVNEVLKDTPGDKFVDEEIL